MDGGPDGNVEPDLGYSLEIEIEQEEKHPDSGNANPPLKEKMLPIFLSRALDTIALSLMTVESKHSDLASEIFCDFCFEKNINRI